MREVQGKKVEYIKPLCSRNYARLALINKTFVLTHLPKKPLHTFFFLIWTLFGVMSYTACYI